MDALLLIFAFGVLLLLPFALAKLWFWFYFWCGIAILLAIGEAISFLATKKTMSQKFWAWRRDPAVPIWKKWAILAGMSIFWLFLLGHLFLG